MHRCKKSLYLWMELINGISDSVKNIFLMLSSISSIGAFWQASRLLRKHHLHHVDSKLLKLPRHYKKYIFKSFYEQKVHEYEHKLLLHLVFLRIRIGPPIQTIFIVRYTPSKYQFFFKKLVAKILNQLISQALYIVIKYFSTIFCRMHLTVAKGWAKTPM